MVGNIFVKIEQIGEGDVGLVWGHGLGSTDPGLRTRFNDGASKVGLNFPISIEYKYGCWYSLKACQAIPALGGFLCYGWSQDELPLL